MSYWYSRKVRSIPKALYWMKEVSLERLHAVFMHLYIYIIFLIGQNYNDRTDEWLLEVSGGGWIMTTKVFFRDGTVPYFD